MESLGCAFEGRFTDDIDFQVDSLLRNRNPLKKWDGEDAVESMGFIEPLFPDASRKSLNQRSESSRDDTNDHSGKSIHSFSTTTSIREFGTTFSVSVNKPNEEKFASPRRPNRTVDNSVLSCTESSVSSKRAKITSLQSPVHSCQVHGCNKDLSSSKDYYRKHKVCDVHSKTAVVIVNGIQQRFCQQCSRFHILAEFDEGKRSCRKRLAGHNERRRKPQFLTNLDASKTSLIFSRILLGGFIGLQCNELTKFEEEPSRLSPLPSDIKFDQFIGRQYRSNDCLDSLLSVTEFSGGSNSSCALSLLSTQSHNFSATPLGESTSLIMSNSSGVELEGFPILPNAEVMQESNDLKPIKYPCPEGVNTIDLLELSSHLERVEQQKYFGNIKIENDIFCDSTIS